MNFQTALKRKKVLEGRVDSASKALKVFPRGNMGLTPDEVKKSSSYKKAKQEYAVCFSDLRVFNNFFIKNFKSEYRNYRNKNRV